MSKPTEQPELEAVQSVVVREQQPLAAAQRPPDILDMLQGIIAKGVTGDNVKAVEALAALSERMEARNAQRLFAASFAALQGEMGKVKARKAVPNNDGTTRYRFAPYEEIMAQVAPLLAKHGFAVDFSQRNQDGHIVAICTLTHAAGHSKTNEFSVRIGAGPPRATECQADGAAGTYAKRFALCNALNIVIEQDMDGDPRAEGGKITQEQAKDLERRVMETGSDRVAFLRFAGAKSFEEILQGKYALLDENLRRKERTK